MGRAHDPEVAFDVGRPHIPVHTLPAFWGINILEALDVEWVPP